MFSRRSLQRWAAGLAITAAAGMTVVWAFQDSRASEKPAKGWLGVGVQELTPSLREKMKLGNETGLLITEVVRDSPADDAGLKTEDVIMQFEGSKVEQAGDFSRLVRNAGADKKVTLLVLRHGERKTIEVMLAKRRTPSYATGFSHGFGPGKGMMIWGNRPRLGVQVHELDENLAAYFKVEPGSGVLVLEVNEDSPAAKAGLKSGDVIGKVDSEAVRSAEDLMESLQDYEEGDQVKIEYVRQGRRETATVEIDQASESGYRFFTPGGGGMRVHPFGSSDWNEVYLDAPPQDFDIFMPDEMRSPSDREIRHQFHQEIERELRRVPDFSSLVL